MTANGKCKFCLGQIVATPGAIEAMESSGQDAASFLRRHAAADWGEVSPDDGELNNASLVDGSRILSAYRTLKGMKIWVITEATDDDGHRAATTLLLPED